MYYNISEVNIRNAICKAFHELGMKPQGTLSDQFISKILKSLEVVKSSLKTGGYTPEEIRNAMHSYINPEFSGHDCASQAEKMYLGVKDELEGHREHSPQPEVAVSSGQQVGSVKLGDIVDKVVELAIEKIERTPIRRNHEQQT